MLVGYNFLLLDEPTDHFDAASCEELENTLLDYSGSMFIVSHDRYFINDLATRMLLLRPDGICSFVGNYDDFLAYSRSMQASGAGTPVKAEKAAPKVNDYKLTKESASKMRKLETALKKLQEEIEQTEERIANLNELIGGDLNYETLMEKTSELDQLSGYLDILYAKWEAADSELTLLTD